MSFNETSKHYVQWSTKVCFSFSGEPERLCLQKYMIA